MEILTRKNGNITIIAINGRLDSSTAREFTGIIETCIANGELHFIINVSGLVFISSAGLNSFVTLAKKLQEQGGKIIFVAMNERIERIFKLTGFYNTLFNVYDSEETALKELQ
ncbi:MAG: STAS domain-containing protein [Candidatus Magnetobacterium sp. LHC-1]|uniref:Anti-sigma factor antagonist n=1 Tax=Candidatus Magnetobacterium casense TaxID=1455061 RepID=A0ABS6RTT7_9BACT|nr:STAS domain-containing protein [Candidatus Magnetobacterium casensis]MBF0607133.1 STAS domain-containing protein [Nitrospirota bacterium]MBV6340039.1 STAS domain-containing protein [Candidatus Magnetobacterium casensis]